MPSFLVRPAAATDLTAIKKIADANKAALGFLPRPKISEAIQQQRVLVLQTEPVLNKACPATVRGVEWDEGCELAGFVIYRHRKTDKQTTLSDICVTEKWRGGKGGQALMQALVRDCIEHNRDFILLKCPTDLPANYFYEKTGFTRAGIDNGKHRPLNIWRLDINSSEAV